MQFFIFPITKIADVHGRASKLKIGRANFESTKIGEIRQALAIVIQTA
jgi:hypothetical protein